MRRIVLSHWNADEAAEGAALLRAAGYESASRPNPARHDLEPFAWRRK